MDWHAFKLIAVDLKSHSVYWLDNAAQTINGRFPYSAGDVPVELFKSGDGAKSCLVTRRSDQTSGSLYIIHLSAGRSYRLPVDIPAPHQAYIDNNFDHAYLVTPDAALYHLDIAALSLTALAQTNDAICSGLTVDGELIYAAWETSGGGIMTCFSASGELLAETAIDGIPTNILRYNGKTFLAFTQSPTYGEGLAIVNDEQPPSYVTIQPPHSSQALNAYPCGLTADNRTDLLYIVNEDCGSITYFDCASGVVRDFFSVGRSITSLFLLPDARFAIATSNMFADLSLLDLVNRKLLSITDDDCEYANVLAVLK